METTQTERPPATQAIAKTKLDLVFLGADGFPIEGLKGRVVVDGEEHPFVTDAKGATDTLHALPDTDVQVHVQRMDGSYKEIQSCEAGHTDACWSFISPSIVFEATTQLHQGEPGAIEQEIPIWESGDEGERDKGKEAIEGAAPFEDGFTPTQVVLGTKSQPSTPAPSAQSVAQVPKKSVIPDLTKAKAKEVAYAPTSAGRDAQGNPMVVFTQKVKDWWGAWRFPAWSLSWGAHAATPAAGAAISSASGVARSAGMEKQVKELIDFAEEQITYQYDKTEGTASVYAQMKNGTFKHASGERPSPRTGPGRCYQWVRVALARAGVTEGYLADEKVASIAEQESARLAGEPLIRKGFKDVTDTLPDARWAAAGDVIVYAWTPETWDRRKKQKNNSNLPNFGHIDIRSYKSYISDFIPEAGRPSWGEYTDIRIYRKVYDPLPTMRIRAFLHCLRDYECQEETNETKRYSLLNTALPGNPSSKVFSTFGTHPWYGQSIPAGFKKGVGSTAAGAYQITLGTWTEMVRLVFGDKPSESELFKPMIQDRLAVAILESTNHSLSLIRCGKIEEAVKVNAGRWSSLPGGAQNVTRRTADKKHMDMAYFIELFDKYLIEEKAKEKL